MKLKNYERMNILIVLCVISLMFGLCLFSFLTFYRVPVFKQISGVVQKENMVSCVVSDSDLSLFYKNKYIYINNKRVLFKREKIVRKVLKKKSYYHQLFITFSISGKYKDGDIITFSIEKNKIRGIEIFQLIWKGD